MKIVRSSKCYFNKWLTKKKQEELRELLEEYAKACNYFVETFEEQIPSKKKFDLILAKYRHEYMEKSGTFLTSTLIQQAFAEAYGAVQSAKSHEKYHRPIFKGKSMTLTNASQVHGISNVMKLFDYNIYLTCLRTDRGRGYHINIPLKKHEQFNKWYNKGKICSSVTITDKYALFSFEIETGEKKDTGELIGFDFGLKRLGTLSNGTIIGESIEKHIQELRRKKYYSKAYYRKKEEIKEYIDKEVKDMGFSNFKLVVTEKLKNMKYKMKERGRLSKNMRSVLCNLSYKQVLTRIQMLCEENRVTFRSVPSYYTSQECSSCGHTEKENRLSQELFTCRNCGYTDNADSNASKVILKRFTLGAYGLQYKQEYLENDGCHYAIIEG